MLLMAPGDGMLLIGLLLALAVPLKVKYGPSEWALLGGVSSAC